MRMSNFISNNRHTNGPFEEGWWLDLVSPGKWKEVVVKRKKGEVEEIIARLPYIEQKGKLSLPCYTQTLGIWIDDEFRKPRRGNAHLNSQKEMIHELVQQLPSKGNIDLIFDCSQEYILPFRWEGFAIEPRFSYRIRNLENISEVESNFSKNVKRDYNRGGKLLRIDDSSESIQEFLHLQNLTYERQGRKNPVDNKLTEKIISKTIEIGHGHLILARDSDNKAHAGCFMLYDDRICYHLMSGQDTSFGNDGAMPFLLYNEIMFAKDHSKAFDFEGSMVEGIEQVYRRYGGDMITLWHVTRKGFISECMDQMKPRIKRILGYKL